MKKLFLLAAVCGLILPACGSGSGTTPPDATANVTLFQPELIFSHKATPIRLLGSGFGARRTNVTVRFTAESGTPFDGATQAAHESEGNVESDGQIRFDLDPTFIRTAFNAFITIIKSDGSEAMTAEPLAYFEPQEIISITPDVSSDERATFTLTGNGFSPPQGLVRLRFIAETGTPFNGGGSKTVEGTGTVLTPTTIEGIFPSATSIASAPSFISIITPEGDEIRSATPIVTFFPIPSISGFNPSIVSSGADVPFTITGGAFNPIGGTASITVRAETGTPFANGTTSTINMTGTVISGTLISGTMPNPNADAVSFARVEVDLSTGGSADSALPLVQIFPTPVVTGITPSTITSGATNYPFILAGANFRPNAGTVTVNFVADAGTPFTDGTVASLTVTGTILSPTEIVCAIAVDPDVDAQALVTVTVDFSALVSASTATGALTVDPVPPFTAPAWVTAFGTVIGGVSDDSSTAVPLTGGFSFDFYGTTYSSVHFGSNGYLSMGFLSDFSENGSAGGGSIPTIQGWWDDLNPASSSPGNTFYSQLTDRAIFTWDRIHEFGGSQDNSFQIQIWDTGRIDIVYNGMGTTDGQMGIHGGSSGGTSASKDFSSVTHPSRDVVGGDYPYEQIFSGGCDFDPGWLIFEPDGTDGYQWATGP